MNTSPNSQLPILPAPPRASALSPQASLLRLCRSAAFEPERFDAALAELARANPDLVADLEILDRLLPPACNHRNPNLRNL